MPLTTFNISIFDMPADIFTEISVIIGINKVYSFTAATTTTATTATVFLFFFQTVYFLLTIY